MFPFPWKLANVYNLGAFSGKGSRWLDHSCLHIQTFTLLYEKRYPQHPLTTDQLSFIMPKMSTILWNSWGRKLDFQPSVTWISSCRWIPARCEKYSSFIMDWCTHILTLRRLALRVITIVLLRSGLQSRGKGFLPFAYILLPQNSPKAAIWSPSLCCVPDPSTNAPQSTRHRSLHHM